MPRGDKSKYTPKQRQQARKIEEGYEDRGVPHDEAERRAWATVNKMTGGGRRGGSGEGKPLNKAPARKGGRIGGHASASLPRDQPQLEKPARTRASRKR
jgi:plasmid stabilization system protein ParE